MTHLYHAYGLTIRSDAQICCLPLATNTFDVGALTLEIRPAPLWVKHAMRLPVTLERPRAGELHGDDSPFVLSSFGDGKFFHLSYGEDAQFLVDAAAERVWGSYSPALEFEDLLTYLLGPVMGFVLRRRSVLALHSSAVCIAGRSVILCGASESGKSTTAAAVALRGVPVSNEDITPVRERDGAFFVEPGYPRICLWPESVKNLFGTADALPQLTPTWEKCFLALDGIQANFEAESRQLGAIYLLAPRDTEPAAPRIESLSQREALLELVQNTYMNWLLDRDQRAAELDVLSRLVTRVPVRRVVPHSDPARIGDLCDLILADAESLLERRAFAAAAGARR